ncbi:hypothetical protein SAMN03003324_02309 [Pedobacter antarcticus]|nr:hypothetical protein [Pedobacter antarcticus]SFF06329.1 hypothetical protein SAMN03003324_02309 [Pedobacter antarcticus]
MKSRAIFLLVIFLLNTVIGIGCALSMENNSHNEKHRPKSNITHHHLSNVKSYTNLPPDDFCCKSLVNDLVVQSKLIPEIGKVQISLPVIWLPAYFYQLPVPATDIELHCNFYTDYSDRPPKRDIRTVIQSFQI